MSSSDTSPAAEYQGPWLIHGAGQMSHPETGELASEDQRAAFIAAVRAKVAAGTATPTEQQGLAAVEAAQRRSQAGGEDAPEQSGS